MTNIKKFLQHQPWVIFMVFALFMQQGNMLTYKLGGQNAPPHVFLTYSFFCQAIFNFVLLLAFKNRGFPIVFQRKQILPVLFVTALYILNETLFVAIYRVGAPYALATAILSVCSLLFMIFFGVVVLKETLNGKQIAGVILALVSIAMVKMG